MDNPRVWAATACLENSFQEHFDPCADVSVRATHVTLQTPLCQFLLVSELCAAAMTQARSFVQLHELVLLRRHLSTVGDFLPEFQVAPTVALSFKEETQVNSYVYLSRRSRFNLKTVASQCDCRKVEHSNRCRLALADTFNYVFFAT